MLTDFGFFAREEGDDFLILTCPGCTTDIMFTQFVDPVVIHTTVNTHVNHCAAQRAPTPHSGLESAGFVEAVAGRRGRVFASDRSFAELER
jgi:hypothetical protein